MPGSNHAHKAPAVVRYGPSHEVWGGYRHIIESLIDEHGLKRVCDVGGGANPLLAIEFVRARGLQYTVLDISQTELDKAPEEYKRVLADIAGNALPEVGPFDLMFTKMLAEHVKSGERLHKNIFQLLERGGFAVHFFPTLYSLPFVVNRLMPENLASGLLDRIAPRDRHRHAKFPAYYSWCRGPTPRMLQRLEAIGYEVVEYRGLFGHGYYKRVPGLRSLHKAVVARLLRRPSAHLTSYALVILRKPKS